MIAGKPTDERLLVSEIFGGERTRKDRPVLGTLREPARDIPVYRECDVLIVGGGPSGTAAAVAAARLGAEVVLLERYNFVWIWMGDADKADPSLVPDVHWMSDPGWVASEGYHHVKAGYRLLNDNLLDLSHETYVHGKTIGHESVAETPISIRTETSAVYVDKEMKDCNPPPFYQYLARVSASDRVDRWQHTVFFPPGYIVIDVGV